MIYGTLSSVTAWLYGAIWLQITRGTASGWLFEDADSQKTSSYPCSGILNDRTCQIKPGIIDRNRISCQNVGQIKMNRQDEMIFAQGLMEGMIFGYWVVRVSLGVEKITV